MASYSKLKYAYESGRSPVGFLAVQRQVIRILGHQHLGQQARSRDAFVNYFRRNRRLNQSLALGAYPFTVDVALHRHHARCVVQLLADVFANAFELAATSAGGGIGFMVHVNAGQFCWQGCALGFADWFFVGLGGWCQVPQLLLDGCDGCDVNVDGFVQQTALSRI